MWFSAQLQAESLRLEVALDGANGKVQLMADRAAAAEEHAERVREQLARVKTSAAQREREVQEGAAEREQAERQWQDKAETTENVRLAHLLKASADRTC